MCNGNSREVAPFNDILANGLQARAHDNQTCGDDTNIHFDYGDS